MSTTDSDGSLLWAEWMHYTGQCSLDPAKCKQCKEEEDGHQK